MSRNIVMVPLKKYIYIQFMVLISCVHLYLLIRECKVLVNNEQRRCDMKVANNAIDIP